MQFANPRIKDKTSQILHIKYKLPYPASWLHNPLLAATGLMNTFNAQLGYIPKAELHCI